MSGSDLLASFDCRFHHIGVACRSIEKEARSWEALGYRREGDDFKDMTQGVRGRFLIGAGPRLELLEPKGDASQIHGTIARGTKLYHQAFETPRLPQLIEAIQTIGWRLTVGPVPADAFDGRRIAFVLLPTLNLIEFIEAPAHE